METDSKKRTLSKSQVGLLLVVGGLAATVQVIILIAFFNSGDTASAFESASFSTTNLANLQREALLLQVETYQYLGDPSIGTERLKLQKSLLSNQLRLQMAQAGPNGSMSEELVAIEQALNRYDALLADLDRSSGNERLMIATELGNVLSDMEHQVKQVYDAEEQSFFRAISAALRMQRLSQILLLSVSALVIMLGIVLTLSLRRTVRALRKEMSERLHAENELQLAHQRLIEAQDQLVRTEKLAAIGQLSGGVAHDLRNPLGAIKNSVYYLKRKLGTSEEALANPRVGQFLQIMEDEIGHCNQIITDLMGYARVNTPTLSRVKIEQVIDDALGSIDTKGKIGFVTDYDPNLPEILADGEQLQRVFVNLAINARDAMPNGGELRISTRQKADVVEIAFNDEGEGIPSDRIDKIFDPLFTTKTKGTGLGLAICHQVVSKHDGSISVSSQPGQGTTFTVSLPIDGNVSEETRAYEHFAESLGSG